MTRGNLRAGWTRGGVGVLVAIGISAAVATAATALPDLTDEQVSEFKEHNKAATTTFQKGEHAAAAERFAQALLIHGGNPMILYNQACAYAMAGETKLAIGALERAFANGYSDATHARKDTDLAALFELPEFEAWAKRVEGREKVAASWPVITASELAADEAALEAQGDEREKRVKRLRGVVSAEAYNAAMLDVQAWRAASWDRIADSREGEASAKASLTALEVVAGKRASFADPAAAGEAIRRADRFQAQFGDSPLLAAAVLTQARSRHALAQAEAGALPEGPGQDAAVKTAGQQLRGALRAFVASDASGDRLEGALVELIGLSGDDIASARTDYARLGKLIGNDEVLHDRVRGASTGVYYTLEGMPEFAASTIDGATVTAKSLHGKVTLVEFWATWCGPCKEELPALKEVYGKYNERGFQIVGISLDNESALDADGLRKWVAENAMPWPQIYDGKGWEAALAQQFGVKSIPFAILLDRNGSVLAAGDEARGDRLAESLAKVFAVKRAASE